MDNNGTRWLAAAQSKYAHAIGVTQPYVAPDAIVLLSSRVIGVAWRGVASASHPTTQPHLEGCDRPAGGLTGQIATATGALATN